MSIGAGNLTRETHRRREADGNVDLFFQRAMECAAIGEFAEAINALHEVTKNRPDYFRAWSAKATLYRLVGNEKMAELCAKAARGLEPTE